MTYEQYLARKRAQYGSKFDPSELAPQFVPYFGKGGPRIRVRRTYANGETRERTGTVGVTTGWRPAFLLMHRSTDHGSSDVLGRDDVIVAVKYGSKYLPI